ncbi:uncharacterized protein LOC134654280 [Cydia amplana]|uniref:uncharacterized protein LOC134654280 n=1 Tax=Cydia amplana TaxID=1869771 RepID=UPI002FE5E859
MASPTTLFNNLVKKEENCYIDAVSKAYLWMEVVLGLNRLVFSLKIKPIFILLASAYSIFCCAIVFYDAFFFYPLFMDRLDIGLDSVHYLLGVILSSIVWKRLQHYYLRLQDFDTTIGCRPKISSSSVKNLILMCIAVSLTILVVPYEWYTFDQLVGSLMLLPVHLLFLIDIHFYGHLLSLLVPRLRLINYYMKMSLSHHSKVVVPKIVELTFKSVILESQNCQMKKLMDLYCMIINAYDILIDAIKWQFVMVLTALFISILTFSYKTALMKPFYNVAIESSFHCIRLFPLFAPCIFADQIQEEVRRLRELLASRLYENKLNKPGRSVARALLSLTEARDLSFSLLQIFDIDISLPFKFMGLLLTYLIILLQFEKVINP